MSRNKKMVHRWFNNELLPDDARNFFKSMRRSESMQAEFNYLTEVEKTLCGTDAELLTHTEMERIHATVIGYASSNLIASRRHPHLREWMLAAAALIMLCSIPATLWLTGTIPDNETIYGDFGQAATITSKGFTDSSMPHLLLFCVSPEGGTKPTRLDSLGGKPSPSPCSLDGEFQFAVSNPTSVYRYVYVYGLDENGRRLWYFPKPDSDTSIPVAAGTVESLLGNSVKLSINHRPGKISIFAIFSIDPLDYDDVTSLIRDDHNPNLNDATDANSNDDMVNQTTMFTEIIVVDIIAARE